MSQNLTWKVFKFLFYYIFIFNWQWLKYIFLLCVSTLISYCVFNIDINRWQVKDLQLFNSYMKICIDELIVIAVLNTIFVGQFLQLKNAIINYFKNVEHYTEITPKIVLKASLLLFSAILLYLSLPQLILPIFIQNISVINILTYFFVLLCFIVYNIIITTFIEVTFGQTVKTKLNLFILNILINYNVLALLLSGSSVSNDKFLNYLLLSVLTVFTLLFALYYELKKIDSYMPCTDKNIIVDEKFIHSGVITVFTIFVIIFKIFSLIFNAPATKM